MFCHRSFSTPVIVNSDDRLLVVKIVRIELESIITKNSIEEKLIHSVIKMPPSLLILPVELLYRILEKLDDFELVCVISNVCVRLNMILQTYHRYQVRFIKKLWKQTLKLTRNS